MINDFKIINDDKHANKAYLSAIMTWPNDKSRIKRLTLAAIQNLDDVGAHPQEASVHKEFVSGLEKALWPGFVTGKIFITCLYGKSLSKSRFLVRDILNNCSFHGKRRTLHIDTVHNYWREYKNVAHLWAAYVILYESADHGDTNLTVQIAQILHQKAIDNNCIQDWEPITVETDDGPLPGTIDFPEFPSEGVAVLKKYKSRT